jgi:leader peptidase (prepilin peptidase)/N-methyltransferase
MEYLWWVAVFFTGAAVGSFLNVCICRMPVGESVVYPPSHCPFCQQRLGFYDLVPVLSYVLLKGKCRYCGCRISRQYPVVEFVASLLFILVAAKHGFTLDALRAIVLVSVVIPAAAIDLKYKIIPDKLNLAGFVLGLPLVFESRDVFFSSVTGFLAGGGLLFLIAVVSRGGMGGGDIKLAAVLGLLLGWKQLLVALFLAFAMGGIAGLAMIVFKVARLKEPVPFGPYLALGAVSAALLGDKAVSWYAWFLRV